MRGWGGGAGGGGAMLTRPGRGGGLRWVMHLGRWLLFLTLAVAVAVAVAVGSAGCAKPTPAPPPPDARTLSAPRAVAVAYLDAVEAGDATTLRELTRVTDGGELMAAETAAAEAELIGGGAGELRAADLGRAPRRRGRRLVGRRPRRGAGRGRGAAGRRRGRSAGGRPADAGPRRRGVAHRTGAGRGRRGGLGPAAAAATGGPRRRRRPVRQRPRPRGRRDRSTDPLPRERRARRDLRPLARLVLPRQERRVEPPDGHLGVRPVQQLGRVAGL